MTGESISSIGSYPGLNVTGLYNPYNPSMMMPMMGSYSSMTNPMMTNSMMMSNPMMMTNPMMMAYSNPDSMKQYIDSIKNMYSAQNEIQKLNLYQSSELHEAKEKAQVHNVEVHDRAFFETVMKNGEVQKGIREIYDALRDGKSKYAGKKFAELKHEIISKYSDHFNNSVGGINDRENIDHYICTLYSEIGSGFTQDGTKPDFRQDAKMYGENDFLKGFYTAFLNNKSHDSLTGEELLHQTLGTEINDKGSKNKARIAGNFAGHVFEFLTALAVGAITGAGLLGFKKLITPSWASKLVPEAVANSGIYKWSGKWGTALRGGACIAGLADFCWQLGRS